MRQPKMKGGVKECDNRTLRSDEIDSVVLKEVLKLVFSRHNLEKYSEMIADSVNDEKKELEAPRIALQEIEGSPCKEEVGLF